MTDQAQRESSARDPAAQAAAPRPTIDDLIAVCTSLIGVLERETGMLERMRARDIKGLQDEKTTLALSYLQLVKQLSVDAKGLRTVEPVLRDELRSVLRRLEECRSTNERALSAAREANERVIRCIVEAVADRQAQAGAYGPNGAQAPCQPKHADDTMSLTLNQRI